MRGDTIQLKMPRDDSKKPSYLAPYFSAAERHDGGFKSLLWASVATQEKRFDAFTRLCDFHGKTLLDVGCGRADLLDYLIARGIEPFHYVGLEAVPLLADAAEAKKCPNTLIRRGDFITDPRHLFVGAEIVAISGSLNTLEDEPFYAALRSAYDASAEQLIFNFLSSPLLAGTKYLHWRRRSEVKRFIESLGGTAKLFDGYIEGDCTIHVKKPEE
jgi:SAM-dependent methyltransferase